ncbi:MAG: nuclease [Chromatiaceae bacterium]|nr:MAG: nuclease [Chromatiaceae bacterium]
MPRPAQTFSLLVDDREHAAAVLPALRRLPGVQVRLARLAVGDYQVDECLLFERKTLPDLVRSLKDGRLFSQALRLANAPLRAAIILEGRAGDLAASQMRREAIQGALIMLTLFLGLPLLRAADARESATLILLAARQGRAFASGALPRHGRRPRGKARLQSHILQGLPGIGPTRARRLLDRFGSIEAIIAASAADLASVEGIGKTTAAAIRWAIEEPGADYAGEPGAAGAWPC